MTGHFLPAENMLPKPNWRTFHKIGPGTRIANLQMNSIVLRGRLMTSSLAPTISVGTLSGKLPTGAGAMTRGSSPLDPGASPFNVESLNESNAATGVTFQPFSTPHVTPNGALASDTQAALLLAQEQLQL